jgi:hypothetical protein
VAQVFPMEACLLLINSKQNRDKEPQKDQPPSRGVMDIKGTGENA